MASAIMARSAGDSAGTVYMAAGCKTHGAGGRRAIRRIAATGAFLALTFAIGLGVSPPVARADQPAELDLPKIVAITAGADHYCLLGDDGSVWCWGDNHDGELGLEVGTSGSTPQRVVGIPGRVRQVVASVNATCAVAESGGVWCWGSNFRGQLGDGTTEDRRVPTQVLGLDSGVAALARSNWEGHMCAIRTSGSAVCWGRNDAGQLGDGTTDERVGPVQVSVTNEELVAIVVAPSSTCALTAGGAVRCWGTLWADWAGRTEEGATPADRTVVTPLGLGAGVKSLTADGDSTCALLKSGEIRCWTWGLDDPAYATSAPWNPGPVPEAVPDLPEGIEAVQLVRYNEGTSGGTETTASIWACATSGDRAWCWGDNRSGQLGDGTTTDRPAPVQVQTGGIAQLTLGFASSLALVRDGSLVMWGSQDPTPRSPFFIPAQPTTTAFREPDTLVPAITTHIPTPADISTDPPVVGANLLLAALAMIAFVIATELLNRSLGQLDPLLRQRFRAVARLDRARARLDASLVGRFEGEGHARRADALRILGIAAFYGVVFALLDPAWNPLSVTGLWLVVIMAVAAGLIGLSGDIAAWATARHWGVAADLAVKPGSLMTAVGSTLFSRALVLVPGVIIGSPEALDVDAERLDQRRLGKLAGVGLGTILGVGLVAWLATLITTMLQGGGGLLDELAGGIEAFLLLAFAAAVQNGFVQLLSLRESAGLALRRAHRILWAIALLGVTFAFWHTLVNPRGDLATALGATNVQAFLATVAIVLAISVVAWAATTVAQRRQARTPSSAPVPAPVAHSSPDAELLLVETQPTRSVVPVAPLSGEIALDVSGNVRDADGSFKSPAVAPLANSQPRAAVPQPSEAAVRGPGIGINGTPAAAPPTSSPEPAVPGSRNDDSGPGSLRDQGVEDAVDEAMEALAARQGSSSDERKGAR